MSLGPWGREHEHETSFLLDIKLTMIEIIIYYKPQDTRVGRSGLSWFDCSLKSIRSKIRVSNVMNQKQIYPQRTSLLSLKIKSMFNVKNKPEDILGLRRPHKFVHLGHFHPSFQNGRFPAFPTAHLRQELTKDSYLFN